MATHEDTERRKVSPRSGKLNPGGMEYEQVAPEGAAGTDPGVNQPSQSGAAPSSAAGPTDVGAEIEHHPLLDREGGPKQPETEDVQRGLTSPPAPPLQGEGS